jgi:hypothetical protein
MGWHGMEKRMKMTFFHTPKKGNKKKYGLQCKNVKENSFENEWLCAF